MYVASCGGANFSGDSGMRERIALFVGIAVGIAVVIITPDEAIDENLKIQLVLFFLSVKIALLGVYLGLDARGILIERHDAVNRYERPHVIEALEALFVDMDHTKTMTKAVEGSGGAESLRKAVFARVERHVDAERQIASRFLDIGLAEIHPRLDPSFRSLGETITGASDDESVVAKLGDAMDAVSLAINSIKNAPPI